MRNFIVKAISHFIPNKKLREKFKKRYLKVNNEYQDIKKRLEKIEKNISALYVQNQWLKWYDTDEPIENIRKRQFRFFKNIPAATGDLYKLQCVLSYMLKEFDEICQKNSISYWLQAGSLLGAYRHSKWIPWDDDLDVGMLECELIKLKNILKNNDIFRIDDYYHFREGYVGRFTRIKFKNQNVNCFLDIPVYQYCDGNTKEEAWKHILEIRREFEVKIKNLKEKLSRTYQNEIITDPNDYRVVKEFYDKEINFVNQQDGKYIYWAHYSVPAKWKRIFEKEMFFPLQKLQFENDFYSVPRKFKEYLELQYGDISFLPMNIIPKHVTTFNLYKNLNLLEPVIKCNNTKQNRIIGYTAGAFDVFHSGHLNLIKKAKENCDYLIVGITTNDLIYQTKNKKPLMSLEERMEILKSIKFVDEVIIQDDLDKVKAWEKIHYDILFSGDDWKGSERWKKYESDLSNYNVKVMYFPYTENISSTKIQNFIKDWN